jgi:hypothetical protein
VGKRSRKRGVSGQPVTAPPAAPARPARRRRPERPKAPWHPVPLTEFATLVGIILLVIGFFSDRKELLAAGLGLASLGGLDTALREHFSGYKSHTTVLAGLPAVVAAAVLFFAKAPWLAVVGGAVASFVVAFWLLRRAWKPRAGGR